MRFALFETKVYSVKAMIVDLFTFGKSPYEFDVLIPKEEIELESDEAKLKTDTKIKGKISKRITQVDVDGEISATVETECSRCLQPIEKQFEIPFGVSFVTPENYTEEKEAEINEKDLQVSIFEGDKIDLSEIVREQILLNLPTQVFCQDDCKGLCLKCGANRNLTECNCEENETDPRWSALRNLK